jgi:uncharacterized protein (DUF2141 family)
MSSSNAMSAELTITVKNIDFKRGGSIIVMLFSEQGFPKDHDKALALQSIKASNSELPFYFKTSQSELAVKVLHDENEDGKVSKNWTRILPAEGPGFSNKQRIGLTGVPKYKKSKVALALLKERLTISMIYP